MTNRTDDNIYLNFFTNNVDIVSRVHVAVSRNLFECSLYINGKPAGRGISTVSVSYQNAFLVFGVDYRNNSNYFTGTMSDISIYSQSLSDSEIISLYNSQVGSTGSVFSPTLSPSNSATGGGGSVVQTGGDGGGGGENVGCNIYCIIGSLGGTIVGILAICATYHVYCLAKKDKQQVRDSQIQVVDRSRSYRV